MPSIKQCCCNCPTKLETGLPDSLVATFDVLTSGGAGIPADEVGSSCPDSDPWYNRFSESSALIDLLSSITFDYVEAASSGCGSCCFRYTGRGAYTPLCPDDAGVQILFGASPFDAKAVGDFFTSYKSVGPTQFNEGGEPFEGTCCPSPSTLMCEDMCGAIEQWSNGEHQAPRDIHGEVELLICVSGTVVTICVNIAMTIPCKTTSTTGLGCVHQAAAGIQDTSPYPDCYPREESFTCEDATEGCTSTTVEIPLSATFDVAAVSGADLWEKIKNAPAESFVSDYEYAACSCAGGGCSDSVAYYECPCGVTYTCECFDSSDPACEPLDEAGPAPIDIDCIYSVGTIDIQLDDE